MIRSLIDLRELATTHPDFGEDGNPGPVEYEWADRATDILDELFLDDFAVEDFGE